jgi:hypothetical protein
MKKSEFKKFIKEEIIGILSEEEGTISTKDEAKAEKLAKKGLNVNLTEEDSIGKHKVGDILSFKDGEDWKVMK